VPGGESGQRVRFTLTEEIKTQMKIQKTTTTKYSLNIKEISEAILQSMNLQEDLVDSIVFLTNSSGPTTNELGVEIIVSFKEDMPEILE
jgi:phosphopantetheine adenylyltransferase